MKNILNLKNSCLAGLLFLSLSFTACSEDETPAAIPIDISGITTLKDLNNPISQAALGDFLAIHGTGLDVKNIDSIHVNDVKVNMLETYSEDGILYMQVPVKLPINVTDKVYIFNSAGTKDFSLKLTVPDLKLTRMFNEYTMPGDTIKIYGDFFELYEITPENAIVDFGGKTARIIDANNTALVAEVPADVEKSIKVKVKSTKFNVEATCPGRYFDKENLITDFDEIVPKYASNIITDLKDPQRFCGNFMRVDSKTEYYGWNYILMLDKVKYTDDMLDHPENYVVKCEFRTAYQLPPDQFVLHTYIYWASPALTWNGGDFIFQKLNNWETISLPFNTKRGGDYPLENHSAFEMRVDIGWSPNFVKNFSIDNVRISKRYE